MHKYLRATSAAIGILCAGALVPVSAQAGSTTSGGPAKSKHAVAVHYANHVRTAQHALPPSRDITSFSSSTRSDAGVNHPPKK
jgi:hypothetical protein